MGLCGRASTVRHAGATALMTSWLDDVRHALPRSPLNGSLVWSGRFYADVAQLDRASPKAKGIATEIRQIACARERRR